eukprot:5493793-Prymnesium_polylepis.1
MRRRAMRRVRRNGRVNNHGEGVRRRVDAIGCDAGHGVSSSSVLCVLCPGSDSCLWLPSRKQAAGLVRPAV